MMPKKTWYGERQTHSKPSLNSALAVIILISGGVVGVGLEFLKALQPSLGKRGKEWGEAHLGWWIDSDLKFIIRWW